jgi:hypothetical protein
MKESGHCFYRNLVLKTIKSLESERIRNISEICCDRLKQVVITWLVHSHHRNIRYHDVFDILLTNVRGFFLSVNRMHVIR